MVVLAVDVRADRPANGYLTGAGGHHRPQPERHQGSHQAVQAHAGLDPGPPDRQVDVENPIQAGRVDDLPAGVLSRVTVAAPQAASDEAARSGSLMAAARSSGPAAVSTRARGGRGATPSARRRTSESG